MLRSAERFNRATILIACTAEEEAPVFSEIATAIDKRCRAIEEKRVQLFRLLHPSRDEFERTGWPGDDQTKEAQS